MHMLAYHFLRCVSVPLTAVLMAQDYAWHSAGSQWLLFRRNAVFLLYKKSGQNSNILDKSIPPPETHQISPFEIWQGFIYSIPSFFSAQIEGQEGRANNFASKTQTWGAEFILRAYIQKLSMVECVYNPSFGKAETGGSLVQSNLIDEY